MLASGSPGNSSGPRHRWSARRPRPSVTGSGRLLPANGSARSSISRTARPRRQPWPQTSAPASPNSTSCSRPAFVTGRSSRSPPCGGLTPTRRSTRVSSASHCLPRHGRISPRHRRPGSGRSLAVQAALNDNSTAPAQLTLRPPSSTRPPRPAGAGNWQPSAPPTTRPPPRSPPPPPSTMPASTSSSGTAGPQTPKLSQSSAPSSWTHPCTRRDSRTTHALCTGQIRKKPSSSGNCRRSR